MAGFCVEHIHYKKGCCACEIAKERCRVCGMETCNCALDDETSNDSTLLSELALLVKLWRANAEEYKFVPGCDHYEILNDCAAELEDLIKEEGQE